MCCKIQEDFQYWNTKHKVSFVLIHILIPVMTFYSQRFGNRKIFQTKTFGAELLWQQHPKYDPSKGIPPPPPPKRQSSLKKTDKSEFSGCLISFSFVSADRWLLTKTQLLYSHNHSFSRKIKVIHWIARNAFYQLSCSLMSKKNIHQKSSKTRTMPFKRW